MQILSTYMQIILKFDIFTSCEMGMKEKIRAINKKYTRTDTNEVLYRHAYITRKERHLTFNPPICQIHHSVQVIERLTTMLMESVYQSNKYFVDLLDLI